MKKLAVETWNIVIVCMLVTIIAVYGGATSLISAVKGAFYLILHTLRLQNLHSNFFSVQIFELVNSFQLISISISIALVVGILFAIMPTWSRSKLFRSIYDGLTTVLESVPDAMYVVVLTIVFLILLESYRIDLPVYSDTLHPSFVQTIFPALTISLPAGLYIRKTLGSRLEDELKGQYVVVARSKGNSIRRTFVHHIFPNLGPVFLSITPSAISLLLSNVLFATYFLEYHDLFNRFTQAIGWSQNGGFQLVGHIFGVVPTYQNGTIWLMGVCLVGIWAACLFVFRILQMTFYPYHRETTSAFSLHSVRKRWIVLGSVIMAIVLFFGTFPQVLTPFKPDHIDYGGYGQAWPLPISSTHPFGTDDVGRDLLSLILYGTWGTILPAVGVSLVVTALSVLLSILVSFGKVTALGSLVRGISRNLSSLPAFFVIFLILYPQNAILAHGHSVSEWKQVFTYVSCLVILEVGRGTSAFSGSFDEWRQFSFMQGVRAIGKSEVRAVFSNLRPWLVRLSLTFGFSELSRIMSLMTQLAAFRIFLSAQYGYLQFNYHIPPVKGVIPLHSNWFSTVGSVMNQFAFISYPYVLFYPFIFILLVALASNFIARGIRGGNV